MIDSDVVIKQSPRAAYRKLGEGSGAVILHLDTAEYHGVNEVGSVIWSLLENGATLSGLVRDLEGRLEEPPADLEQDVGEFLDELHKRDLVRMGEGSESQP